MYRITVIGSILVTFIQASLLILFPYLNNINSTVSAAKV